MDTVYSIIVNIKTLHGMQEAGHFTLGDDRNFAHETFDLLKGNATLDKAAVLRIDLVEQKKDELGTILKSLSCTLNQQAENSKVIIREIFRFMNLEK